MVVWICETKEERVTGLQTNRSTDKHKLQIYIDNVHTHTAHRGGSRIL